MEPTTPRPRLDALTGLRYFAALSVLLAHMGGNLPPAAAKYLHPLSGIGMPLFFTLSGFLMAYNYSSGFQKRYGRTLWSFYVARFARIYPVYIFCLLLYFSFVGNFFHDLKNRPDDTRKSLLYVGTLTQSWGHTPVFAGDHNPRTVCLSYMPVAWSVSTEAFFYLVFPLFALPLSRSIRGRRSLLLGCAGVYAAYLAAGYAIFRSIPPEVFSSPTFGISRPWWKLYLSPYIRFGEFLIGAMVGQYFLRSADRPVPQGVRWWAGAGMLAGALTLLIWGNYLILLPKAGGAHRAPPWLTFAAFNVLYAPMCAVIIYQLAALPSLFQRGMGCGGMVVLGEMSYCLYLLHPLAQSFYYQRSLGEGPMKEAYVVVYNNLAMVVVLHLICLGMYRYFEVPARSWIRNQFGPRPEVSLRAVPLVDEPLKKAA